MLDTGYWIVMMRMQEWKNTLKEMLSLKFRQTVNLTR